jgi:hypothetical protein
VSESDLGSLLSLVSEVLSELGTYPRKMPPTAKCELQG